MRRIARVGAAAAVSASAGGCAWGASAATVSAAAVAAAARQTTPMIPSALWRGGGAAAGYAALSLGGNAWGALGVAQAQAQQGGFFAGGGRQLGGAGISKGVASSPPLSCLRGSSAAYATEGVGGEGGGDVGVGGGDGGGGSGVGGEGGGAGGDGAGGDGGDGGNGGSKGGDVGGSTFDQRLTEKRAQRDAGDDGRVEARIVRAREESSDIRRTDDQRGRPERPTSKRFKGPQETAIVHVASLLNNTFVTLTNMDGDVLAWASGGTQGFKGSRRATSYAAQVVAEKIGKACITKGFVFVAAKVKGPGYGKEAALRGLKMGGVQITSIRDVTAIPFNGCRQKRKRRV
eukprot:CAMPEP_0197583378 /NCGR_PEP_ID=MMETSP1326-20131121/6320_1 /TAXON_ID=1155430 /ORGANISM="Genus nov. species nov., Strain RCC2288" /LENGTH=345 /DNA_ID=CAMNT_0043147597 /DNA_START=161 /DNA_END=1198 /DNA_ORIENTATION=-